MDDRIRVSEMWSMERQLMQAGYQLIAGVDEAGRGPLAGPVCTAAVILPPDVYFERLNDSKQLTEKQRDRLYDEIREHALAYQIALVSNEEIDRINIRNATFQGMCTAVRELAIQPDFVLIDGNCIKGMELPHRCVIKGDAKSASIAAASVLAKVTRDRYMLELDRQYPQYGFAKHKGYPTKAHYQAIAAHGACPAHRRTFKGVAPLQLQMHIDE